MLDLISDDIRRDPFPMYEMVRGSSPAFQPPGMGLWMVLDYEGVKRALTDHESFSSAVNPPMGKAASALRSRGSSRGWR